MRLSRYVFQLYSTMTLRLCKRIALRASCRLFVRHAAVCRSRVHTLQCNSTRSTVGFGQVIRQALGAGGISKYYMQKSRFSVELSILEQTQDLSWPLCQ